MFAVIIKNGFKPRHVVFVASHAFLCFQFQDGKSSAHICASAMIFACIMIASVPDVAIFVLCADGFGFKCCLARVPVVCGISVASV